VSIHITSNWSSQNDLKLIRKNSFIFPFQSSHSWTFIMWKWGTYISDYEAASCILTPGLNSIEVCYCNAWPAGSCMIWYVASISDILSQSCLQHSENNPTFLSRCHPIQCQGMAKWSLVQFYARPKERITENIFCRKDILIRFCAC
jgi:hypothetical protein